MRPSTVVSDQDAQLFTVTSKRRAEMKNELKDKFSVTPAQRTKTQERHTRRLGSPDLLVSVEVGKADTNLSMPPSAPGSPRQPNVLSYSQKGKCHGFQVRCRQKPKEPISSVPPYPTTVRLSSNPDDFDPQKILEKLALNKYFRGELKAGLCSVESLKHFKQIIDRLIPQNDPCYVNVLKEFGEGRTGNIVTRNFKAKSL